MSDKANERTRDERGGPFSEEQVAELYDMMRGWQYDAAIALLTEDNKRLRAELAVTQTERDEAQELYNLTGNEAASLRAELAAALADRDDFAEALEVQTAATRREKAHAEAAMPIVRAVAACDNSDDVGCFQLCPIRDLPYRGADGKFYEHTGPCVFEQARAVLASTAPAAQTADSQPPSEPVAEPMAGQFQRMMERMGARFVDASDPAADGAADGDGRE